MVLRIGLGVPGMGLTVRDDGSVGYHGDTLEEVVNLAARCLGSHDWPEETASIVKCWVDSARQQVATDEFEKRVQRAAEPRLRYAAKVDRNSKHHADFDTVKRAILDQEREKLKKAAG